MGQHKPTFACIVASLKLIASSFTKILLSNRISLARSLEDIPKDENVIVQEYVDKVYFLCVYVCILCFWLYNY